MKKQSNFNRSFLIRIAQLIKFNEYNKIIKLLENQINLNYMKIFKSGTWEQETHKFINFLNVVKTNDPSQIKQLLNPNIVFNTQGNSKLKFLSFSNLPIVNCIGAGSCKDFCYSLKAWRYPQAFYKQARNTILTQNHFSIINDFMNDLINSKQFKKHKRIDFRLYVDGDFNTIDELKNWMNLLKKHDILKCYGYSKSLPLFKYLHDNKFKYPSNYKLNLSNGGQFDTMFKWAENNLDIVRGRFLAIDIGKNQSGFDRTKDQRILLKEKLGNKKYFVCGGVCSDCTKVGHACGLDKFNNIDIVIPIH